MCIIYPSLKLQKNVAEKKKLIETVEREIDRVNNDIKNAQYDLKRLPKERE